VGFFVNTLVLRAHCGGGKTFREYLGEIREMNVEAQSHQDVPLEMVVERVRPQRSTSHEALFQIMFSMNTNEMREVRLKDLKLTPVKREKVAAKFDLMLEAVEDGESEGLKLSFTYNCDLFEGETVERLGGHYLNLLLGIAENPERNIELLPLLSEDENAVLTSAREAIDTFPPRFEAALGAGLRRKLGFTTQEEGDMAIAGDLLERMAANKVDYTLLFRRLCDAASSRDGDERVHALFENAKAFDEWAVNWRTRLAREEIAPSERASAMRRVNPAFIPRNHRVEAAIVAAQQRSDFAPFEELLTVLTSPYDDQPHYAHYANPPTPEEVVHQTFCGT